MIIVGLGREFRQPIQRTLCAQRLPLDQKLLKVWIESTAGGGSTHLMNVEFLKKKILPSPKWGPQVHKKTSWNQHLANQTVDIGIFGSWGGTVIVFCREYTSTNLDSFWQTLSSLLRDPVSETSCGFPETKKTTNGFNRHFLRLQYLSSTNCVFLLPPSPLAEVLPNDPPHSLSSSAPMEEATPNVKTTGRFRDLKNSMAQHGTTIYANNSTKQKFWLWDIASRVPVTLLTQ